ncbi:alanyl-tRNA synthetase domain-containing protein (plasmid) [Streptantibioticus cattleyicolor NRRL 8057 = DSM 46488]|uniref:Alanyl-tRNA synthetase domain-containing protein n=1 Tax=Streptantibioticus cattleyicolor (strain ATCC 35852 / DSM 46488 / JCM 4925 / NBRC 14057 / NRRL 8057) TaxID=1003195 RepID=F8JJ98_STREN|nr:alanyl-tRNA synthetase domain-containing protein [Streptantibioticus cattleyicolor NRRL 8057 = DSM 46488]CCB72157.1 conserved protein of unknown function [Streptantibioticus cattleyicolor NRRL 8057 = DSM 46488]
MTQQRQIYLTDTYAYEASTRVVSAERGPDTVRIALADNIFHPQGGGQPDDRGWVDQVEVRPVRDTGPGLVHLTCPADAAWPREAVAVGTTVTSRIDPALRRLHAALHTAGHLVDALIDEWGYRHVGSNHFPGQARVEYDLGGLDCDKDALAEGLTERLGKPLAEALPVIPGERDGRRTITIEGYATEFCAGTHVPDLSLLTGVAIRSVKVKGGRLKVGYTAEHVPVDG